MKLITRISLAGCTCAALALFSPVSFAQDVLATAPEVGTDHPQPSSEADTDAQFVGNGQSPQGSPGTQSVKSKSGEKLKKLIEALHLNKEQKSALKPIIQQSRLQAMAIRKNTSLSEEQKHAEIKQIRHSAMEQIKSILTPGQRGKLREFIARAKEHSAQNQQQG